MCLIRRRVSKHVGEETDRARKLLENPREVGRNEEDSQSQSQTYLRLDVGSSSGLESVIYKFF